MDAYLPTVYYWENVHGGGRARKSNWVKIESALRCKINTIQELELVIQKYRAPVMFNSLHLLSKEEQTKFFQNTLPIIIEQALKFPQLQIEKQLKILKCQEKGEIILSTEQIACLLANAFLCTYPPKSKKCPGINFANLVEIGTKESVEKLKCIFNYFEQIKLRKSRFLFVKYMRFNIPRYGFPKWDQVEDTLTNLQLVFKSSVDKAIENEADLLQVDFANKHIGGGVLGNGCVQEEILFVTYPELILSRLFTETLEDNETLIVIGAEKFNKHSGYSTSFQFKGNYIDKTPINKDWNCRRTFIVAIDALNFSDKSDQYYKSNIEREINKAYVGFSALPQIFNMTLVTGNWGCGAFSGDPYLKFLIQIMAYTKAGGKNICYSSFGNEEKREQFKIMYEVLEKKKIKDIWKCIIEYIFSREKVNLFEYIQNNKLINSTHPIDKNSIYPVQHFNPTPYNEQFRNRTQVPHFQSSILLGNECDNKRFETTHRLSYANVVASGSRTSKSHL